VTARTTGSPETGWPLLSTVTLIADDETPLSAAMLAGLADT
jgi:hypothetical protein